MSAVNRIIKIRFWIILFIIIVSAALMPSQFGKGGIDLSYLAPVSGASFSLVLFFSLFLNSIPRRERVIIPLLSWPIAFVLMTIAMEDIWTSAFDEDFTSIDRPPGFFVNLIYYGVITLPILVLTKIYAALFPY